MKKVLFAFGFLICAVTYSQTEKAPLFLTLSSKGGSLLAHRPHMAHLVNKNAYGFDLSLSKQQIEYSREANRHKFPLNGLTIEFRNFGNDKVLGHAFAIHQYQSFNVFQTKKNLCLNFQMGGGIGYLTKFYDKEDNPTNNAIGSRINAKVSFKLELNKYFDKIHLGFGTELSHFSNGAIQLPNLGLNNLSAYVNVGYNLSSRQVFDPNNDFVMTMELPRTYFLVEGIFSVAEVPPIPLDPKKYPIFAGRFSFIKPKSKTWNYELALDVVYNPSNQHRYYDSSYTAIDVPQVGIYAGMSMNYYKSQIVFGLGYYVIDKINPLGRIYNRIGYRYFFNEKWCGLFNIRANFGRADFFEFGIGYKF